MGVDRSADDREDVDMEEQDNSDAEDGEMQCDFSAYVLFHEGNTGAPCLSFDILKDELGENRDCNEPVSLTFISGSQAEKNHLNKIVVLKMKDLKKIDHQKANNEDDDESDDEDEITITSASTKHDGCVNRIRATVCNEIPLAASWSEHGQVNIWELSPFLRGVESVANNKEFNEGPPVEPIYTFDGHQGEGFAVDWSPTMPGTLATGDCSSVLHIWKPIEGNQWSINRQSLLGHTASIEDIQWSPNEQNVLASCSVDRSIRIWDIRAQPEKACMLTCSDAHTSDINVIHWNRNEPFIASGGDDSSIYIWDLRKFKSGEFIAHLKSHTSPITCVEWHHADSSVLASGGEDDQILQWDLAVEKDEQEESRDQAGQNIPDQLLFIHKGQKEIKELHWHHQIPGLMISTSLSGFNVFKTISC